MLKVLSERLGTVKAQLGPENGEGPQR